MSSSNPVVAVVGATGSQGGAVVRTLSSSSVFSIHAISRNPSSPAALTLSQLPNVTVITADLSDKRTLLSAFQNCHAVYAVTNFYDPSIQSDTLAEARQGCNIADAAKECSVDLVIWSTAPSALLRTAARFDSPRLVENKFTVSQYLKYRSVPHCDLNLGFYMENWMNFGQIAIAEDGAVEVRQPILKPDTDLGMVWLGRDLGPVVLGILKRFEKKKEGVLGKQFYAVGGRYSTADFARYVQKETSRECRVLTTAATGVADLDVMFEYYNGWGIYTENEMPDPMTMELGVEFGTMEGFVKEAAVPYVREIVKG